jgi:WD40 repeat protein/predicted Ser/Thr protein kinase
MLNDPTSRQARLRQALDEYFRAAIAGEALAAEQLIACYPDLQAELQAFFTAQETLLQSESPTDERTAPSPPRVAACSVVQEDFGDYELLEEIGRGGMGVVYKARQRSLDRIVALKMILAGAWASDEEMRRFQAEAQAAAALRHPGVVPIYEIGEFAGCHFFSMAFIEGRSLAEELADGPLPPREAAELTRRLAEAVAHAHGHGIIHRDLKPGNVLIDREGRPHITDFGLAKHLQGDAGLTASNQVLGTPSYMPPEQAAGKGRDVGPASDVYALGAVLYALLTGRPPFQADNPVDTILQVLSQDPVPPRQLNAAIPADLETICLKCLEKERSRRYPQAQGLLDDLQRFLEDRPVRARPLGWWGHAWRWSRRNKATALALGALSGAAVVIAVVSTIAYFRVDSALQSSERRLRVSEARRLAAASQACQEESPARSLLLAIEALRVTQERDEPRVPAAEQALRSALSRVGGVALGNQLTLARGGRWLVADTPTKGRAWLCDLGASQPFEQPIEFAAAGPYALSADERWLASGTADRSRLLLWDLAALKAGAATPVEILIDAEKFRRLESVGRWLIAQGTDRTWHLWDTRAVDVAASHVVFRGRRWPVVGGGRWLLTQECGLVHPLRPSAGSAADLVLWDLGSASFTESPLVLSSLGQQPAELTLLPGGRWCLCREDAVLQLLDLSAADPVAQRLVLNGCKRGTSFPVSDDGRWAFAVGNEGQVFRWDLSAADPADTRQVVMTGATSSVRICPLGRHVWINDEKWADGNSGGILKDLGTSTEEPRRLPGSGYPVKFSPDSRWVVLKSDRNGPGASYHLWDCRGKQQTTGPILLQDGVVQQFATIFSPDSRWLMTGDGRQGGRLWDLSGGAPTSTPLQPRPTNDGQLYALFSPDSRRLVWQGSDDPIAKLIDLSAPSPVAGTLELRGHEQSALPLFFDTTGRWLFTHRPFNDARAWDLARSDPTIEPRVLRGHTGPVRALDVSPDGRWLASGSDDRTVRLWDLAADFPERQPVIFGPHDADVRTVRFSPRGDWILTVERHNPERPHMGRLWRVGGGAQLDAHRIDRHTGQLVVFLFSPDGHWLATAGRELELSLWDLNAEPPRVAATLPHPLTTAGAIAFTADSRVLATANTDGQVRVWNLGERGPSGQPLSLRLDEPVIGIPSSARIALSDNGRWLAATNGGGDAAYLWDLHDPAAPPRRFTGHLQPLSSVRFSPGGRWLATRGADLALRLYDLTASDPEAVPIVFWRVYEAIQFSRDGHWMLTAGNNSLWDLRCRNPAAKPIRLRHAASTALFGPDGRWAAAVNAKQVVLWDLTAEPPGEEAVVLEGHTDSVSDQFVFAPDSRWLATTGNDREIRIWSLRIDELAALAKRTAGRELFGHERDQAHLAVPLPR